MTTFGITSTGFVPKSLEDIRSSLNEKIKKEMGDSFDLSDNSFAGITVGLFSYELSLLWDLAQALSSSLDPDSATKSLLDSICAITGTYRIEAKPSIATIYIAGTSGNEVAQGFQVKASSTGTIWETIIDENLINADNWVASTTYAKGTVVKNSGRIYVCQTGGISAASGGPTLANNAVTDNTVIWTYVGDGDGYISVKVKSLLEGPVFGSTYDLKVINTPLSGINGVINITDATLGNYEQSDESLRVSREAELYRSANGDPDAIRASLLTLPGVTSASIFVNNTDYDTGSLSNNDLMTPHSIEALVIGGDNQEILERLFNTVAGGIKFIGSVSGTVLDSEGKSNSVSFSRPTELNLYVSITITKDPSTYPLDGDNQVKNAIITYSQQQHPVGKDAISSAIAASIFPVYVNGVLVSGVKGVLSVVTCFIGLSPSPTSSTPVSASNRQKIVFDTSRITVSSSNGTF